MPVDKIQFEPIGIIHLLDKNRVKHYEFPAQGYMDDLFYSVELHPKKNFEQCLKDLDGFSHIWILFHFDDSDSWKPMVVPPRGPAEKRGVFATRSPNRPNAIGMTAVELLNVNKRKIMIRGGDFLDGTPVLDIKPYIIRSDSIPEAKQGWIDRIEQEKWRVSWEEKAATEANRILSENKLMIRDYATKVLEYNRESHPYRRIYLETEWSGFLKIQRWRVGFKLITERKEVIVHDVWLDENERA